MNVFVVASVGAILIIIVTTFIIAFTPLREFIPGYSSSKLKREAIELALKSDSLSKAIKQNEDYLNGIKKVLTGKLEYAKFNKDSILESATTSDKEIDLSATDAELELREQVALEDQKAKSSGSKTKKSN
ncbi:peptidase [Flavobacterium sp. T-16]